MLHELRYVWVSQDLSIWIKNIAFGVIVVIVRINNLRNWGINVA
jgi:hypothetical protein